MPASSPAGEWYSTYRQFPGIGFKTEAEFIRSTGRKVDGETAAISAFFKRRTPPFPAAGLDGDTARHLPPCVAGEIDEPGAGRGQGRIVGSEDHEVTRSSRPHPRNQPLNGQDVARPEGIDHRGLVREAALGAGGMDDTVDTIQKRREISFAAAIDIANGCPSAMVPSSGGASPTAVTAWPAAIRARQVK